MLEHRKFSLQLKKAETQKPKIDRNKEGLYNRHVRSNIECYINISPNKSNKAGEQYRLGEIKGSLPLKNAYDRTSMKSEQEVSINSLHKQRIIQQRRSYSFSKTNKNRSYSIDQHMSDYFQKLPHSSTENPCGSLDWEVVKFRFNQQYFRLQQQFRLNLEKGSISEAFDKIAHLLNYSIDLGSRNCFFKVVSIMCQFYEVLEQHKRALRLYIQYKQAALLQKDYKNLILSLVGIARCAATSNMFKQAIVILKKALDYAWYINSTELELLIYDELGEKYYKMGEIERATTYHTKYSNTIIEAEDSPLRILSKQQLQFLSQNNITHNYQSLSPLFIAHLNLPLKSLDNLPSLAPGLLSSREKLYQNNIFNQDPHEIQTQIKRLFKTWLFQSETEEPSLENVKEAQSKKMLYNSKKYAYIDFKMNRHFKNKGIKLSPQTINLSQKQSGSEVKKKMSLDEKISVLVKQPGLDKQWYQSMVKRVKIDQKRKLAHISDPVRVTKNHNSFKSKVESLKILFKQIIDFVNSEMLKNSKRLF